MTEEQRQAALEALDTLAEWANKCLDFYPKGKTVPDILSLKEIVSEALQSATISETQLESEIKKTAMSEKKATPVPSNINDNITITMDSKGRMIMKLKPCYELGKDIKK